MVALGLAADPAFPTLNVEQNAFSDLIASQNNHRTPQVAWTQQSCQNTHLLKQHNHKEIAHAQGPQLDSEVKGHARRLCTTSLLNMKPPRS